MTTTTARRLSLLAAALALAAALPGTANAQDYGAMIQQQMNLMNQNIMRGQQQVNSMVQQRMQDPQVRASYEQYVAQMRSRGQAAMDFPTYTYNYIYTRGFTREGTAFARANEAGIQQRERATVQGLREAEARRGQAQQQQSESFYRNQQERGRGLMGQSTYSGSPIGQKALPHTWQPNTQHDYQGNTYRVNESGQYYVRSTDGWWYPINR